MEAVTAETAAGDNSVAEVVREAVTAVVATMGAENDADMEKVVVMVMGVVVKAVTVLRVPVLILAEDLATQDCRSLTTRMWKRRVVQRQVRRQSRRMTRNSPGRVVVLEPLV